MHYVSLEARHIAAASVDTAPESTFETFLGFSRFPAAYSAWRHRAIANSTATRVVAGRGSTTPAVDLGRRRVALVDRELAESHGLAVDLACQVMAVERVARDA